MSVWLSLPVEDKYFYLTVIEDYNFIQAPHLSKMYAHCSRSSTCEDQSLVAEGRFYMSGLKCVSHKAHNLFNTDGVASSIAQALAFNDGDVAFRQVCIFRGIKGKIGSAID